MSRRVGSQTLPVSQYTNISPALVSHCFVERGSHAAEDDLGLLLLLSLPSKFWDYRILSPFLVKERTDESNSQSLSYE